MAAPAYPELHDIPAAAPRRTVRSARIPMPDMIRTLFKSFPLLEWPAARAVASEADAENVPCKPILYVASQWPGQWASADPVSLRWQMELLLRGAEFEVVALDDAYWAPEGRWNTDPGNTPFLHLSPDSQSPLNNAAGFPCLLPTSRLPQFVENHYPLVRPELEEKSVWPSEEAKLESVAWHTLLYGRITAGALLLALQSNAFTLRSQSLPFFRSFLGTMMPGEATGEQRALGRILQLASAGASHERLQSVYGANVFADQRNPLHPVPGYTVDFVGVLSGTSQHEGPDGEASVPSLSTEVNHEEILQQAANGLAACAARLDVDLRENPNGFMLNASRATSLDCLLFAVLHTILSVPPDSLCAKNPLRTTVERHPVLSSYAARFAQQLPQGFV